MKKVIYLIASALFCLNAEAQTKQSVADFNAIEVGSAAKVKLVQSDTNYIVLNSKTPMDKMNNIKVEDGVLKITSPVGGNIEVHVKNLTSVRVRDAAEVECADTLKTDRINVHISDAGSAAIWVNAKYIRAKVNDAGNISFSGSADSLTIRVSDASHANTTYLRADNVTVVTTDGSNADVLALKSVDASASDGSRIRIKGNPVQKNTNVTDGGSVSMNDTTEKSEDKGSGKGNGFNIDKDAFIGMGFVMGGTQPGAPVKYGASREFILGFGHAYNLAKWNALGWDVYYKSTDYYLNQDSAKTFPNKTLHQSEKVSFQNFGGLVYDRFYIGKKIFLDGGIYGDWTFHSKLVTWDDNVPNTSSVKTVDRDLSYVNPTNYGITIRAGSTKGVSLYFNYRLSNLFQTPAAPAAAYPQLPVYTLGIALNSF